jgi:hypothetical protein
MFAFLCLYPVIDKFFLMQVVYSYRYSVNPSFIQMRRGFRDLERVESVDSRVWLNAARRSRDKAFVANYSAGGMCA